MPHLLLIDDEVQIRRVMVRSLGRAFAVTTAVDAEMAIAMLDASMPFDVILCDLELPRMSGHDLYDELQRRSNELTGRFVIMTGGEPAADDAFAAALGERYVRKPFSLPELIATLGKAAFPRLSAPD